LFSFLRFASTQTIDLSSNLFIPNSLASIPAPSHAATTISLVLNSLRTLALLFCTLCRSLNVKPFLFNHLRTLCQKGRGCHPKRSRPLRRYLHNHRLVRTNLRRKLARYLSQVLSRPEIPHARGKVFRISQVRPRDRNLRLRRSPVEQNHCAASVFQLLHPNFLVAVLPHAASLHAQRILVNRDNFLVRQNRLDLRRHRSQIISRDQRRCKHRPQTKVRTVLHCCHSSVAHFEHVRIVPVPRSCCAFQSDLHIHNVQHSERAAAAVRPFLFSFPMVVDVPCGPPQIPHVLRPLPRFRRPPFAHAEYDRPSRRRQRIAHRGVRLLSVPRIGAAPVVLQVIDAPARVLHRVLKFVPLAARPLCACQFSSIRIQSELQPFRVDVIRQRFDTGRESLRVGNDESIFIAAHLPAIVDHDVLITRILHSARHHRVGHGLDHVFADVAAEFVPAVPAHRRRLCHAVVPRSRSWRQRDVENESNQK